MPSKNSIKTYTENGFYHIYNRGVEKRIIFQDEQDYAVFLSYLKTYLLPKDEQSLMKIIADPQSDWRDKDQALKLLKLNNFTNEIKLISHSLMPNHFHLLVNQKSSNAIDRFMNSLGTRYTLYFNKKYKRVGSLYQDVYKAVLVETDEQLLHLTRYIHRNPNPNPKLASQGDALRSWQAQLSSLPEYLGLRRTEWIHPEFILPFFSKTNPKLSYKSFVEQIDDLSLISSLVLDI
ncbi:hypothetical protein COY91_02400 [Candidatus Shapirobacteria bacterium CG_4_10_14_0_8_um_filter_39_15]|nr:MAG: hypothetical protein COY91_02400 [Candidatus Shapirobacteria bacterium CG_4_10_14_0_8_um_filter_39_15]PJE68361.1 MAG: hypothetical protein COU94_02285 [Candidatus Shapirobacteria bacterium CG10_big_fil_rev_8_21_14_0_10_38_8]